MRIACPSCAAEYEVPASRLTPGKMVRCARCGGEWIAVHISEEVTPPRASPEQPSPSDLALQELPAITAMDRLAAAPAIPPTSRALLAAWVLTFVVLAGAVIATVTWREAIVRVWPASGLILGSPDQGVTQPPKPAGNKAE